MLIVSPGCSQYVADYRYYPRPALAEIPSTQPQSEPPPLAVLASIIGIRYEDRSANLPASVEVRLQVANNSQQPFPPGRTYLNTDLNSFQLPWSAMVQGRRVTQVVYFRRIAPAYYYRPYGYYDYPPGPVFFSTGVVFVHHR